ncbi:hypothetical protein COF07_06200 [Bacillus wiedmannii]|uniref:Uncharacterized protein n=1 Tax=Bacillus wiedmannii TaxID=1890302 RepID=A0A2B6DDH8_9BACI|nr:hypothetical protein ICW_03575 [Bacillus wiedmannii]EJV66187.1 hypothetical protein IEO_01628 [Bacillus wiedmannii]KXY06414.1 hypothetical protein AT260_20355 [Bacillus wiedmannii]OFD10847.1 hypothetical protein BTGOE6_15080 [Bacillus wiedmannii]OOR27292.1 hypothetical protein BW893_12495 [Bacillus wiedmannii]
MVRLIFYAGTKWLGFRTLFSSCNLIYQVIKELHTAVSSKFFEYYQTEIHLPPIVGLCPSHASGRRILSGNSLKEEGVAGHPGDKQQVIERLMTRGLTYDDALTQYEAELRFFKAFQMHSSLVYAPSMKITFGEIEC